MRRRRAPHRGQVSAGGFVIANAIGRKRLPGHRVGPPGSGDDKVVEIGSRLPSAGVVDCRKDGGGAAALARRLAYERDVWACGEENGGSRRHVCQNVVLIVVDVVIVVVFVVVVTVVVFVVVVVVVVIVVIITIIVAVVIAIIVVVRHGLILFDSILKF